MRLSGGIAKAITCLNRDSPAASYRGPTTGPIPAFSRTFRASEKYNAKVYTKSGLMLGLGESLEEIHETLQDLLDAGCSLLTLGQYLQPTPEHLSVKRFIHPEEFDNWRETALKMGFDEVGSGPFVRSSYHAEKLYQAASLLNRSDI